MVLLLPYVTVNGVDVEMYTEPEAESPVLTELSEYDDDIGITVWVVVTRIVEVEDVV